MKKIIARLLRLLVKISISIRYPVADCIFLVESRLDAIADNLSPPPTSPLPEKYIQNLNAMISDMSDIPASFGSCPQIPAGFPPPPPAATCDQCVYFAPATDFRRRSYCLHESCERTYTSETIAACMFFVPCKK
jgi:hypothetical protein